MPVLNGKGLLKYIELAKAYFGVAWSLTGDTTDKEILAGADLNDYTTLGNYYCRPDSVASQVLNSPTNVSFIMKIYSGSGRSSETSRGNYLTQYLEDDTGSAWKRYKTTGSWTSWAKLITTSNDSIGSENGSIYIKDGEIVASASTVGSGINPIYMNVGNFVASTSSVGSGTNPIYLNDGSITSSNLTGGSSKQPIYVNNGTITSSSSTVGDDSTPIYVNYGVLTKCSSVGTLSVDSSSFGSSGYIKFSMGLIVQWGTRKTTSDNSSGVTNYTVTYPISFSSSSSYVIVKNPACSGGGTNITSISEVCFYDKTARTATTRGIHGQYWYKYGDYDEEWLAIGY